MWWIYMVSTKTVYNTVCWTFLFSKDTKSRRQQNILLLVLGYNTVTGTKWRYLPLASSVSTQTYNANDEIHRLLWSENISQKKKRFAYEYVFFHLYFRFRNILWQRRKTYNKYNYFSLFFKFYLFVFQYC